MPPAAPTLLPEELRYRQPSRWRRLTARLRVLPDAILVGAQRAGTTSLYRYLVAHPQVMPAKRKEVHFFDVESHWRRGVGWYRAHFPTAREVARRACDDGAPRVVFEATPAYMYRDYVPARMHATIPHAKLLVVLRDPVERALSNWKLAGEWGGQYGPFEEEIEHELALEAGRPGPFGDRKARGLLARGRYAEQLERLLAHYPREQLLILESADLARDPEAALAPVVGFLGLSPHPVTETRASNRSRDASAVPDELRARLEAYFAPHDERLAALLGRAPRWR